jgi:hypothetical protein
LPPAGVQTIVQVLSSFQGTESHCCERRGAPYRALLPCGALLLTLACSSAAVSAKDSDNARSAALPSSVAEGSSPRGGKVTPRPRPSGIDPSAVLATEPRASQEPLAPSDIRFGTNAPLSVFAASAHPTWVGLCQVRVDSDGDGKLDARVGAHGELEGDRLVPLLINARGEETLLDHYLGADPSGRYVSFTQAGHLLLRNTETGDQRSLSEWAPGKLKGRGNGAWPPASFDARSRHFAYLAQDGTKEVVVLRNLALGTERRIDPGDGKVWDLGFEPDGVQLRLSMITRDSNGNGRLEGHPAAAPNPPCRGPVTGYKIPKLHPDALTTKLYNIETARLGEVAGFVATMGNRVITRGPERELWLESESLPRNVLSSPSCNGRILHIDAHRDAIVLGCAKASGERRALYLVRAGKSINLKLDVAAFETDGRLRGVTQWLPISTATESTLVDLDAGTVARMAPENQWLAAYGTTALAERKRRLWFVSKATEGTKLVETDSQRKRPWLAPITWTQRYVSLGRELYDLESNSFVGTFDGTPLWVATNGEGLVPSESADPPRLARGPVHWERALPAASESVEAPKPHVATTAGAVGP